MARRGRPKKNYSREEIIAALIRNKGNAKLAAVELFGKKKVESDSSYYFRVSSVKNHVMKQHYKIVPKSAK